MCISIVFPQTDQVVLDPKSLPRSEHDSVPSLWIAALKACGLGKIVHLRILAEMSCSAPTSLLSMPKDLQESIKEFFRKRACAEVPRLSLMGFRDEERDKFPKRWEVVIDHWDSYKEELEGLQGEWEEEYDTQGTSGPGSSADEEEGDP
jgi:hypothetical protein